MVRTACLELEDFEYEYNTIYTEVASLQLQRDQAVASYNNTIEEIKAAIEDGDFDEEEYDSVEDATSSLMTYAEMRFEEVNECDRQFAELWTKINEE